MTDAEKIAKYDRIVEIINDAIALEKYHRETGAHPSAIPQTRTHAYQKIFELITGKRIWL
jgi:hypothetical protein